MDPPGLLRTNNEKNIAKDYDGSSQAVTVCASTSSLEEGCAAATANSSSYYRDMAVNNCNTVEAHISEDNASTGSSKICWVSDARREGGFTAISAVVDKLKSMEDLERTTTTTTAISTDDDDRHNNNAYVFPLWSQITQSLRNFICGMLVALALAAARNPKKTIVFVPLLSIAMIVLGIQTNFQLELDVFEIFKPTGSTSVLHEQWIKQYGPFAPAVRNDAYANENANRPDRSNVGILLHAHDTNLLSNDGIQHVFQIIDTFRSVPEYDTICNPTNTNTQQLLGGCKIMSIAKLWGSNKTLYEQDIIHKNNKQYGYGFNDMDIHYTNAIIHKLITTKKYPDDQIPVDHGYVLDTKAVDSIFDARIPNEQKFIHSYFIIFSIIKTNGTGALIDNGLRQIYQLNDQWQQQTTTTPYRLEAIEFSTALVEGLLNTLLADIPLIPIAISTMILFTCLVFFKCNRTQSRTTLAFSSVFTIVLSMLTAFGLLFCIGVPFASTTVIVPFMIIGVGLDDTFIITGHFFDTNIQNEDATTEQDEHDNILNRVKHTITTVGMSIFVTTLTTSLAFALGLTSDIPAIRWLVTYAFTTVIVDFIYQITFFIAILVLDERRVRANRCDILCCFQIHKNNHAEDTHNSKQQRLSVSERAMIWYSNQLMRPNVKRAVIITFLIFFSGCAYSGTKIKQVFKPVDLVSQDSAVFRFYEKWEQYNQRTMAPNVYFRNVDQSDPHVRAEMSDYLYDLLDTEGMGSGTREPTRCWFTEFKALLAHKDSTTSPTFYEQLDMLFNVTIIKEVFGDQIVRDPVTGEILASRCSLSAYSVKMNVVDSQIKFLSDNRDVTKRQPINQNVDPREWSFFTYDGYYPLFEFYTVHVQELISTTVAGMVSVCLVTLIFVPHWSAIIFVLPIMITLYIDLLGTLQFCGIKLNILTFVVLVVSIGLLVDFVIHVLLAYYESTEKTREGKVKDALRTLGSSICVGGISTFLGIVPLAASASFILKTIYICFLAMIVLGISYGLILLPVILSIVGPMNALHHTIVPDADDSHVNEKNRTVDVSEYDA